jgi:uncharacterized protein (TIGR02145 family)
MADSKGRLYKVTKIDNQVWMAENMATDQATDGSQVTCTANTDPEEGGVANFVEQFGCLYTWEDALKVCPTGWHLPTEVDFSNLISYVESQADNAFLALIAKSVLWENSNNAGTDAFNFSALPAGYYFTQSDEDVYIPVGYEAFFHGTATEGGNNGTEVHTYGIQLQLEGDSNETVIVNSNAADNYSISVRCIKD